MRERLAHVYPSSDGLGISPTGRCNRVAAMRVLTCPLNPLRRSKTDVKIRNTPKPWHEPLLAYIALRATIKASIVFEVVAEQSNPNEVPRICACEAQIPESKDDPRGRLKENSA